MEHAASLILPEGVALLTPRRQVVACATPPFAAALGLPLGELVGLPFAPVSSHLLPVGLRTLVKDCTRMQRALVLTNLLGHDQCLYTLQLTPLLQPDGQVAQLALLLPGGPAPSADPPHQVQAARCQQTYQQLQGCSQMPLGVVISDRKGQVTHYNHRGHLLLSGPPQAPALLPLWHANGSAYRADESPFGRAVRGEFTSSEEVCVRRNGSVLTLAMGTIPLCGAQGKLARVVLAFEDLTASRVAQLRFARVLETERRRTGEVETLCSALQALGQTLALDERLQAVAASLAQAAGANRCLIMLLAGNRLHFGTEWGLTPAEREVFADYDRELSALSEASQEAISTGKPLVVQDAETDPRLREIVQRLNARSLLIVPLMNAGQATALAYLDRRGKRRMFFSSQVRLTAAIASQAAVAIDQARLYRQEMEQSRLLATMISELNHRVKNNLAIVAGLLSLQLVDPRLSRECKQLLRSTVTRIQSIAVIHQLLYEEDVSLVEMRETIKRIAGVVGQAFSTSDRVQVEVKGDTLLVPSKLATYLGLVVNELLCNAIKHGLEGRQGGRVEARMTVGKDKVELWVEDDGNGLPPDFDCSHSLRTGGMIVQGLVEHELKGTFHLSGRPSGGTIAYLQFNRERVEAAMKEQLATEFGAASRPPG